ncbi:hypothetical protein C2S53_008418 [Perilla frutescens var. hirtella]|uniref:Glutamate receptor n=1 Tax=Perilla frutescens var. hirtella TaxID=608512 RepID=A0AAD4NZW5_PERFH|nr:hypothetical protein C2S53_008418 [Perilla frutescens var. hirtella]
MRFCVAPLNGFNATAAKADVGVILDYETTLGKICKTFIYMAIEDFYSNRNHSTMIVPHFRDSGSDVVAAASAAIDLLKNTQVMAILGPQRSIQADFVIDIGDKVRVPIISPATSPALSPHESTYFVRSAWCSSSQSKAIAAIVKKFGWREVVFIYEDTNHGSGLAPFFTEDLLKGNALVSYQSIVSPAANDQILEQLNELKKKQTRVFVVHLPSALASRFFQMAKEAGMMNKGYAWIIADPLTSLLDSETIEAMQGVLGVKADIPKSDEVKNFAKRWRKRFHKENPDMDITDLNVFGLWAYDSIRALAEAIEQVGVTFPRFNKIANGGNLTDLDAIGTSNTGPSLAPSIRNFTSKGLSGDFKIRNGELQPSAFEIVNVIGNGVNTVGFWTEEKGISKDNLAIVWPGQTTDVPKGWEFPASGNKLKVGVPVGAFSELIKVGKDAETNAVNVSGFCIDFFEEVLKLLPYHILPEYIPFETLDGQSSGTYDELVYEVFLQKYDAVVGDVTILANRSKYVEFTVPYSEPGIATIVPVKDNKTEYAWIFMKPLTVGLWLTIGAFFIFTGFVVWVLEHRVNKEFRGPPTQQLGTTLWFSFSTLFFAHRENVISNLTRFVVIVWLFAVLVLTSSYNANLTSMLTVQQLRSTDMIKKGEYIGFHDGSFVNAFMKGMISGSDNYRIYDTLDEYEEALSRGSKNGGVSAIVDEIPYIKLFLSKHCHKYTMINPTYKTSGFGFAFRKGSPLVSDVSTAIMNLREGEKMDRITRTWIGAEGCSAADGLESLNLDRFTGLFLIAGLSSSAALAIFLSTFLYENQHILASSASIKQKLYDLARAFVKEKDDLSKHSETTDEIVVTECPSIRISCDQEVTFSQDQGLSTTEIEMQESNS